MSKKHIHGTAGLSVALAAAAIMAGTSLSVMAQESTQATYAVADANAVTVEGTTITINKDITATEGESALSILSGDYTIVVAESATLKGGTGGAGIYVADGASVKIIADDDSEEEILTAIGNGGVDIKTSGAAGIGGIFDKTETTDINEGNSGKITISGANVIAYGYGRRASGIGSGSGGINGEIVISDEATVTAYGGYYENGKGTSLQSQYGKDDPEGGPAIGGGSGKAGSTIGDITITNSTVTAYGGSKAAGIGAGYWASAGYIIISESTVTAVGGSSSAAIGTSRADKSSNGVTANIQISNSTIEATGGDYGSAIGGGYNADSLKTLPEIYIAIDGGDVTATGGVGGAAIGGGYKTNNLDIEITGEATITATAGYLSDSYNTSKTVEQKSSSAIGSGANGSGTFIGSSVAIDEATEVTVYAVGGKPAIETTTFTGESNAASIAEEAVTVIYTTPTDSETALPLLYAIGINKFTTFEAAYENAAKGDTIKLLTNVEITEQLDIAKDITIDLAGYTLNNKTEATRPFWLVEGCTAFGITDSSEAGTGTIQTAGTSYGIVDVRTPGVSVEINGGNYIGDADGGCLFRFDGSNGATDANFKMTNATAVTNSMIVLSQNEGSFSSFIIDGGNYKSTGNAAFIAACTDEQSTAIIKNATIEAAKSCAVAFIEPATNGRIENCIITARGEYNSDSPYTAVAAQKGATVTIDGGTYTGVEDENGYSSSVRIYQPTDPIYADTTINILSGTFNGDVIASTDSVATALNISGGMFNDEIIVNRHSGTAPEVSVTGGTFKNDPTQAVYNDGDTVTTMDVVAEDYVSVKDSNDMYRVVHEKYIVEEISVVFEETETKAAGEKLYDIYLVAANDKIITRLNSGELTFNLAVQDGEFEYAILPVNSEIDVNILSENRYEFHYDGKDDVTTDTANKIKIGQAQISGYGTFTFGVNSEDTANVVHTTMVYDSIVSTYTPGGSTSETDKKNGNLTYGENVAGTVALPTRPLTINLAFPNAIKTDINTPEYQQMKVAIYGGDLSGRIEIDLAKESEITLPVLNFKPDANVTVTVTDGYTIAVNGALTSNRSYTVEVSGAGYRTARYTVNMQEFLPENDTETDAGKTLNFWNNVKDNSVEVEVGVASSAKIVTYLAGDIVKDGEVNIYDLSAVVSYFGEIDLNTKGMTHYAKYDLNRDGMIDSRDVAYVLVSWGK